MTPPGTYLAVQWLRLCAPTAWGTGSIPGQETKIPHAEIWPMGKKKGKQRLVEINDKIQAVIMHVVQLKYGLK